MALWWSVWLHLVPVLGLGNVESGVESTDRSGVVFFFLVSVCGELSLREGTRD